MSPAALGARAGVRREHELRPAREGGRARGRGWIVTWPRSSGWRSVSSTARRELGRLVEEEHAAVGAAQRAGPDLPGAAADQRRPSWPSGAAPRTCGRVTSGRLGRQRAGDRVDRRDLERRLLVQRRQERRGAARRASSCPRRAARSGTGGARPPRPPRPPAGRLPGPRRRRGRAPAAARGSGAAHVPGQSLAGRPGAPRARRGWRPAAPRCCRPGRPRRRWPPARPPARGRPGRRPGRPAARRGCRGREPSRPSSPSSTSRSTEPRRHLARRRRARRPRAPGRSHCPAWAWRPGTGRW